MNAPQGPRIGSLCSGYEGLGAAIQAVLGGDLAFVADPDPGAARILAHHHPDVPNLGDITQVDWANVPRVDVLAAWITQAMPEGTDTPCGHYTAATGATCGATPTRQYIGGRRCYDHQPARAHTSKEN